MSRTHAERALNSCWPDGRGRLLHNLGGSRVSTSWLVEHGGQNCVLRVDTPLAARLQLNRAAELRCHRAAALAGVAPPVVFAEPAKGILVTRHAPGRTWTSSDYANAGQLRRLAALLERLHAVPLAQDPIDLPATICRYAALLANDQAESMCRQALELMEKVASRPPVLCHNDLLAGNIVDGERLWLIDFEYAGLTDPLFELAVIATHYTLDEDQRRALLSLRRPAGWHSDLAALDNWVALYQRLLTLWLSVLETHKGLDDQQQTQLGALRLTLAN